MRASVNLAETAVPARATVEQLARETRFEKRFLGETE
jgi:hypothetical protein